MAPISLVGGALLGTRMWIYVMPLLVVWIQFLVFVGVTRLHFYDIEVRAARTGELAAGAAEAERLAVVGELSASLAHEIRNPLTGVRSLAQRLAEEQIDDARRQRYASVILEEVGRVERLVTNLLGIAPGAGPASGASTPAGGTDLGHELFDDLLLLLGARAEKAGVRLVVDAAEATVEAPREVVPPGAPGRPAQRHRPFAAETRGSPARAPHRQGVEILVRDSGPGVPSEERERIWEPFHSGSGGTGLGLAVVRRLARSDG